MLMEVRKGLMLYIAYIVSSTIAATLVAFAFPLRLWGFFVGLYVGIITTTIVLVKKNKFGPFRWLVMTFIIWSLPAVVGIILSVDYIIEAYYYLSSPFTFSAGVLFALILGYFADTGEELTFATFVSFLLAVLALLYCPTLEGITILSLAKNYVIKVTILWASVLAGTIIAKYIRRLKV